ncbi:tRNA dihydrouridine synthase DusB [Halomonas denitrificans]|uniref:tRNA dihydrouridine synthase DusB n=1 Tax=Halomonas TaxID=2745 RepID=UPI001A8CAA22|nr:MULTISPECIES: tRNA dihydrouridine synthase DusB [Halomonas]MED5295725.1 tRNA dihydrouridine synthase DusB [Pseudomonadota bacterium]MBN8413500.1 tRNA dihydrouridine synthase DusB [Halomonas litopenaei]MBY5926098.1 tRNA dihydrouridine synthase DusB [Halomonas sp. DP4Y7-2]MBY5931137.1 tRNA dihydrouridine synthase DusB [Halomonas sp. DP8Y7-3]MBY5984658.1 tRNA dihydrouridine synthase DusB [Halomonas sp. DP5Y7-2]
MSDQRPSHQPQVSQPSARRTTPRQDTWIGPHKLASPVILAPMAGVTDRPFRALCRQLGAGLVVGEMVTSDPNLWHTRKSRLRMDHRGEPGPRAVQIAGGDAEMLATAARLNAEQGAEIIDINMGCPAKKVCNKAAGSALLRDEALVAEILDAVVAAVDIPVTLKIRTGWCEDSNNAVRIATLAENAGIQALAVHGRHRQQRYQGDAEYDTIAEVASRIRIPVFANGDITDPLKARRVLDYTGADAVMVGRGAQGNPWIFREIAHYLAHDELLPPATDDERREVLGAHLNALHAFYGEHMGVKIARKHLGWYLSSDQRLEDDSRRALKATFNGLTSVQGQQDFIDELFRHDPATAAERVARAVAHHGTRAA